MKSPGEKMLILSSAQPAPITQDELLIWFGYRSQIAALKRKQAELEEVFLHRLERGADCEAGPHVVEVREYRTKAGRISRLVIL